MDVLGLLSGLAWSSDTIDDLRFALFNERDVSDAEKEDNNNNSVAEKDEETTTKKRPIFALNQSSLDFELVGMVGATKNYDLKRMKKMLRDCLRSVEVLIRTL